MISDPTSRRARALAPAVAAKRYQRDSATRMNGQKKFARRKPGEISLGYVCGAG